MELMDITLMENQFSNVVVYNKSPRYFEMIINMLKRKYDVSNDEIFHLTSLSELSRYENILGVSPLFGEKWIFYIEDTNLQLSNEMVKRLEKAPNYVLVIGTSHYGNYLNWKKRSSTRFPITFLAATRLSVSEFDWIYSVTTRVDGSKKLSQDLQIYLKKHYLRQPESVFTLFSALKNGIGFSDKAEIVSLVGVGNLTVDTQLLGILTAQINTERGLKMFINRRGSALLEIARREGYGKLYRDIRGLLKALIDIRGLILTGRIVVGLREGVSEEVFNSSYHKRLLYRLEDIEKLNMNLLIIMLDVLENEKQWNSDVDVLGFLMKYIYKLTLAKEGGKKRENSRYKVAKLR